MLHSGSLRRALTNQESSSWRMFGRGRNGKHLIHFAYNEVACLPNQISLKEKEKSCKTSLVFCRFELVNCSSQIFATLLKIKTARKREMWQVWTQWETNPAQQNHGPVPAWFEGGTFNSPSEQLQAKFHTCKKMIGQCALGGRVTPKQPSGNPVWGLSYFEAGSWHC